MTVKYTQAIQAAAKAAFDVLVQEYPELASMEYDSFGFPGEVGSGSTFEKRLQMGLYIELIKAGIPVFRENSSCQNCT